MPNGKVIVTDELGRMWKVVVMAYFKILSQHLPTGLGKTMKNLSEHSGA